MEYAIEVRNLTKRYKDFTLDDISFALPRGTVRHRRQRIQSHGNAGSGHEDSQ